MDVNIISSSSGEAPPAVNWSLVEEDLEWRRRQESKSAPPILNVSGFPGAEFFCHPSYEATPAHMNGRSEDKSEAACGSQPNGSQPLSEFQDFINSVTEITDSPEFTPSLQSSFATGGHAVNASFTTMLLKDSCSQPRRGERGAGRGVEPFSLVPDSPGMQPADHRAMPIRIPGFGTSPQNLFLGTPPATLASLGGEPYLLNNSPSMGIPTVPPGTTLPSYGAWSKSGFAPPDDRTVATGNSRSKKELPNKQKGQRLTFQDPTAQGRSKPSLLHDDLTNAAAASSRAPLPTEASGQAPRQGGKDGRGVAKGTERRLFPALEGEVDGRLSSIEEVLGRVYPTAKDQYGCRFLQKMLEDGPPSCLPQVLEEIYDHCGELMTDPFGNYLMQKLVEYCDDEQRTMIAHKVAPHLVVISQNMHGTRAVQTLIEHLTMPEQVQVIIGALEDSVVSLIKDLNGNHVVQRCLQKFSADEKEFIYNAAVHRCVDISTHRHGCCVVQRCLDHASEGQKVRLTDEIARHAFTLVTDPFGNYVVQYVLDLNSEVMHRKVCSAFEGYFAHLCTNKFSSNVMEKCLHACPPDLQERFIAELIDHTMLPKLLQDQYANYVVQTALSVSKPPQAGLLQDAIRAHLHLVRNTPYGKKIENKLNRSAGRSGGNGGRSKARGGGGGTGHGPRGGGQRQAASNRAMGPPPVAMVPMPHHGYPMMAMPMGPMTVQVMPGHPMGPMPIMLEDPNMGTLPWDAPVPMYWA